MTFGAHNSANRPGSSRHNIRQSADLEQLNVHDAWILCEHTIRFSDGSERRFAIAKVKKNEDNEYSLRLIEITGSNNGSTIVKDGAYKEHKLTLALNENRKKKVLQTKDFEQVFTTKEGSFNKDYFQQVVRSLAGISALTEDVLNKNQRDDFSFNANVKDTQQEKNQYSVLDLEEDGANIIVSSGRAEKKIASENYDFGKEHGDVVLTLFDKKGSVRPLWINQQTEINPINTLSDQALRDIAQWIERETGALEQKWTNQEKDAQEILKLLTKGNNVFVQAYPSLKHITGGLRGLNNAVTARIKDRLQEEYAKPQATENEEEERATPKVIEDLLKTQKLSGTNKKNIEDLIAKLRVSPDLPTVLKELSERQIWATDYARRCQEQAEEEPQVPSQDIDQVVNEGEYLTKRAGLSDLDLEGTKLLKEFDEWCEENSDGLKQLKSKPDASPEQIMGAVQSLLNESKDLVSDTFKALIPADAFNRQLQVSTETSQARYEGIVEQYNRFQADGRSVTSEMINRFNGEKASAIYDIEAEIKKLDLLSEKVTLHRSNLSGLKNSVLTSEESKSFRKFERKNIAQTKEDCLRLIQEIEDLYLNANQKIARILRTSYFQEVRALESQIKALEDPQEQESFVAGIAGLLNINHEITDLMERIQANQADDRHYVQELEKAGQNVPEQLTKNLKDMNDALERLTETTAPMLVNTLCNYSMPKALELKLKEADKYVKGLVGDADKQVNAKKQARTWLKALELEIGIESLERGEFFPHDDDQMLASDIRQSDIYGGLQKLVVFRSQNNANINEESAWAQQVQEAANLKNAVIEVKDVSRSDFGKEITSFREALEAQIQEAGTLEKNRDYLELVAAPMAAIDQQLKAASKVQGDIEAQVKVLGDVLKKLGQGTPMARAVKKRIDELKRNLDDVTLFQTRALEALRGIYADAVSFEDVRFEELQQELNQAITAAAENEEESQVAELQSVVKAKADALVRYANWLLHENNYLMRIPSDVGADQVWQKEVAKKIGDFIGRIDGELEKTLSAPAKVDGVGNAALSGEDDSDAQRRRVLSKAKELAMQAQLLSFMARNIGYESKPEPEFEDNIVHANELVAAPLEVMKGTDKLPKGYGKEKWDAAIGQFKAARAGGGWLKERDKFAPLVNPQMYACWGEYKKEDGSFNEDSYETFVQRARFIDAAIALDEEFRPLRKESPSPQPTGDKGVMGFTLHRFDHYDSESESDMESVENELSTGCDDEPAAPIASGSSSRWTAGAVRELAAVGELETAIHIGRGRVIHSGGRVGPAAGPAASSNQPANARAQQSRAAQGVRTVAQKAGVGTEQSKKGRGNSRAAQMQRMKEGPASRGPRCGTCVTHQGSAGV